MSLVLKPETKQESQSAPLSTHAPQLPALSGAATPATISEQSRALASRLTRSAAFRQPKKLRPRRNRVTRDQLHQWLRSLRPEALRGQQKPQNVKRLLLFLNVAIQIALLFIKLSRAPTGELFFLVLVTQCLEFFGEVTDGFTPPAT